MDLTIISPFKRWYIVARNTFLLTYWNIWWVQICRVKIRFHVQKSELKNYCIVLIYYKTVVVSCARVLVNVSKHFFARILAPCRALLHWPSHEKGKQKYESPPDTGHYTLCWRFYKIKSPDSEKNELDLSLNQLNYSK